MDIQHQLQDTIEKLRLGAITKTVTTLEVSPELADELLNYISGMNFTKYENPNKIQTE